MANAFLNVARNLRDRNFGGTAATQVAEPYISGYHYTSWIIPQGLTDQFLGYGFNGNNSEIIGNVDRNSVGNILAATCLSVTPPGGTINKTEHTGLGGVKWSTPTNIDYGNSISCKFLEMSGLPIMRIIGGWCKLIRDNKIGLASLGGSQYEKNNYAATVFYWTTKPDGYTIEYCACYSGVFPSKDPQDLFNGDVASVDKLEMDIDFNVDFVYHEDWVYTKCKALAMQGAEGSTRSDYLVRQAGRGRSDFSDGQGTSSGGNIGNMISGMGAVNGYGGGNLA